MKVRKWLIFIICSIVLFYSAAGSCADNNETLTPPSDTAVSPLNENEASDSDISFSNNETLTPPSDSAVSANELKLRPYLKELFSQCLERQRLVVSMKLASSGASKDGKSEDLAKANISLKETLNRISSAFKSYYGPENGGQIAGLFAQYINLIEEYADGVFGNTAKFSTVFEIQDKADEIVSAFSLLNPGSANRGLSEALKEYSDLSVAEIEMKKKPLGEQDPDISYSTSKKSAEIANIFAAAIASSDKFR